MVKYLALLLAGILAASCIFDADQCFLSVDEPHEIMFTVALDSPRTKASWEEGYDPSEVGVPFDFRIMPDELRMVVVDTDGNHVGTIQDLDYWPLNDSHTQFQFMGLLPSEVVEHFNANGGQPKYRFMVLANCGENMSGEQYITYNQTQLNPFAEDASIPMWGVKQTEVAQLLDSERLDLGEIWLLRAAAKIEVKLCDKLKQSDKEITIKSATLKYYNQTGYCLPSGWSQTSNTRLLDQESCLRVYRHAALNLPFVKDESTGDYYVYVTEYDNINYSGERNKISLSFKMGSEDKEFADAISFCEYSDGKLVEDSHYNIVRNHIYEFEVLSIAGDNLELQYTVADWDAEQWWSEKDKEYKDYEEHELAYPTYHNPLVPRDYLTSKPEDLVNYTIKQSPQMYYNANTNKPEEGAFECFFQIVAPADVKWKPGITGTMENYQIRIYKGVTSSNLTGDIAYDSAKNELQADLGCCQQNQWFRIVVFPLSDDGAGKNNIDFTISYFQEWTQQYIHLYINGEYDRIRWPGSGTNPKIITIAHVEQPVTSEIDE